MRAGSPSSGQHGITEDAPMTTSKLVRPLSRLGAGIARAWVGLGYAVQAMDTRNRLMGLDDRMLKDLGISRAQAEFELSRWRRRKQ
jgi:uncharacterized protein YjiS (DUF1127 family)